MVDRCCPFDFLNFCKDPCDRVLEYMHQSTQNFSGNFRRAGSCCLSKTKPLNCNDFELKLCDNRVTLPF